MKTKFKLINRKQFIKKTIKLLFGFFTFIHFPYANYMGKLISNKGDILRVSELPISGPWPTNDPFLFLVHHKDKYPKANENMEPNSKLANRDLGNDFSNLDGWSMYHGEKIPGFPRHPHRGFETITIVEKGLIDHSDSLGYSARYGDGDVQWLTAGDGIQHSEMFPLLNQNSNNEINFFQIWINLKSDNKRVQPNFSMFWENEIPKITTFDNKNLKTEIEIIAGKYDNNAAPKPPPNSWASSKNSNVNIWKIKMDANANWELPKVQESTSRTLYVYKGLGIIINSKKIYSGNMVEIFNKDKLLISCLDKETKILLLEAKPINEPIVKYGPFVMNTRDEISEAFNDYNETGFGEWAWNDDGPVHGNKYKKFAIGDN